MKCSYHPEIESIGACLNCGRLVCIGCQLLYEGKSYCKSCAKELGIGESPVPIAITRESGSENWFERHLNWTWVIALATSYVIEFIIAIVCVYADMRNDDVRGLAFIINFVIMLSVSIYVLIRKKRSIAWVLLMGFLSPLWLANRRKGDIDAPVPTILRGY